MPRRPVALAVLSCLAAPGLPAQESPAPSALFRSHEPLAFTLETDLRAVLRDRGDDAAEHGATLRYVAPGGDTVSLDVDVRTRGIFRLKHCSFPPLRLDFPRGRVAGTVFEGQDRVKLVTHCRPTRAPYEQNVLQEYLAYRVFNLLSDSSYRVRLASVTYRDTTGRDDPLTRYAFLIESDDELARRLGATALESATIHDLLTEPAHFTLVAVFQYLIGNTDWSVWGRHNMTVLRETTNGTLLAIPFDFDFAGVISAPYATPPPQLPIRSVRERLYRGFCQPDTLLLGAALARLRAAKDSIYAVYRSVADLSAAEVRAALAYFDAFYRTLDNPGAVRREFVLSCRQPPP